MPNGHKTPKDKLTAHDVRKESNIQPTKPDPTFADPELLKDPEGVPEGNRFIAESYKEEGNELNGDITREDVRTFKITPRDVFMNRSWRQKIKAPAKFDDERKAVFLQHLSMTGAWSYAARAAGVTYQTMLTHRDKDVDFGDACEMALNLYEDHLREALYEQAVVGIFQPMIDKNGDVSAYRREMSPNLLLAELRKVNPEYRERSTVDMNVNQQQSGVLSVPQRGIASGEEWEKRLDEISEEQKDAMHKLVEEAVGLGMQAVNDPGVIDGEAEVVSEDGGD